MSGLYVQCNTALNGLSLSITTQVGMKEKYLYKKKNLNKVWFYVFPKLQVNLRTDW